MDEAQQGHVERARHGDQIAWAKLYRDAYGPLLGYATRRLRDRHLATEAVSETMAQAVKSIHRYQGVDDGFTPWLFGICRHVVVDLQRQLCRPTPLVGTADDLHAPPASEALDDAADRALVRVAFERLDEDEREILELRVLGGMSSAEVAAVLGKQPSAVRMAQKRALTRLRALLSEVARVG